MSSTNTTAMRQHSVQCLSGTQLNRMVYSEWGDADNPDVLVCVHGLTRNRHDFDMLATALSDRFRVISPDVAGRGESDWLVDPAGYTVQLYVQHMIVLLGRLGVPRVYWLGTSMGGLIGMVLASLGNSPIRRLLLNDVGPVLEMEALERIAAYVGRAPVFQSLEEAETYIRSISAGFGQLSEAAWHALTESSVRHDPDGWRMRYDPAIGDTLRAALPTMQTVLWPLYDPIKAPVMVLRGALSDILSAQTATEMTQRGPKARLVVIPDTGHAPMLMKADEIALVREFMLEG